MKLDRFAALATAFAAGLVLCGCASSPMNDRAYYGDYPPEGPAPAFVRYQDPQTGQIYAAPNPAYNVQYGSPYGVSNPRVPYGYPNNMSRPTYSYNGAGTIIGAAVGNAINPGNSGSIAAGAILGGVAGSAGDPCAAGLNAGTLLGGAAGYALGGQIGGGDGRKVAEVLGAMAGAHWGGTSAAAPRPGCR